ncbi:UDP-galactose transporter [Coemansia sp. RSA 1822]|nr:UDP-galactose transporter [Coemansia sp. RSA 638]KAJ2120715.1 UDP-galactose transporter [Coemansia sp. RSA 720]KAJ2542015.1 UDP-galactose transporter [Coemansia sp. RSA 1853]KAJ2562145.1 UDP-galactose transporter [Coemansia sp. RSA 1822]
MLDFVVCVSGIYVCFLTWSTLQERVTTSTYGADHQRFQFTIVLNLLQAAAASLVGFIYIRMVQRKPMLAMTKHRWRRFFQVAMLSSAASPFGYMSLRYINYPTMTLAKTCKMVPVMAMNKVLYGRHYATHKYAVVAMITMGVSAFMLCKSSAKGIDVVENSAYGLLLVLVNLAIDGAVNSTQDQVFAEDAEISGQHMMCLMNLCSCVLMSVWLLNPFNPELSNAFQFLRTHPRAMTDIGMFAVCGAMGQCFVFYTLANFGSLTLTTVTVTRKFLSILISVFYNGHSMNARQWLATAVVFAGISLDVYMKQAARRVIVHAVDDKRPVSAELRDEVDEAVAEDGPLEARDVPELVALRAGAAGSEEPAAAVRRRRVVDVAAS